jgi:hypothetical protein
VDLLTSNAQWEKEGKAAGHIRNERLLRWALEYNDVSVCIAFPGGPGTENMVQQCVGTVEIFRPYLESH